MRPPPELQSQPILIFSGSILSWAPIGNFGGDRMDNLQQALPQDLERVEILLVEDDENDIELTLNALRTENLSNRIFVARDGVEALAYLTAAGCPMEDGSDRLP